MNTMNHAAKKSRVNISLELETDGLTQKKELPFKMLMLGDFSHGVSKASVANRPRIQVSKHNLNAIIKMLRPQLHIIVADKRANHDVPLNIDLLIQSLNDFHPDNLVQKIPALKNLYAMRNLLKDLRATILDNAELSTYLTRVFQNPQELLILAEKFSHISNI